MGKGGRGVSRPHMGLNYQEHVLAVKPAAEAVSVKHPR